MPGAKRRFTPKQDRQAGHIAASERKTGKSTAEARRIAFATVKANKKRSAK